MAARDRIRMTPAEVEAFLGEQRTLQLASIGPGGRPHVVPMWFAPDPAADGGPPRLRTWTYARSQKALNLRRLPQATGLLEAGEHYAELRGVSLECDVEILDDYAGTLAVGLALAERYEQQYGQDRAATVAAFEAQARKRVGLLLTPTRVVSWDHRKLGG
jgi:PPOX class probable F420-dependent enzyme